MLGTFICANCLENLQATDLGEIEIEEDHRWQLTHILFRVLAAPEISLNAARTVDLANPGKQALLPGKVSLYVEGAFLGLTEMDFVAPGGVAHDLAAFHLQAMRDECAVLELEIGTLRDIYDEHDGLQDRFRSCGIVTPALAAKLGLTGLAGRASGQARDLRCDFYRASC